MSLSTLGPGLFGIAVRRALFDYLRGVGLVMFILLMVAWTIDLARHFSSLRAAADLRETSLASLLAPYLLQRGVDIVTRLLPMACFFGVFLAEVTRRARLESVIIAAAGFSPARQIAALLWLGLLLGTLQGMLESRWRPAAVLAQVETGFGNYASWFRRGWLPNPVWFVEDNAAIRAEVLRTDQPELRNLLIFEGIREPTLTRVLIADHARPLPASQMWRLEGVRQWNPQLASRTPEYLPIIDQKINLIPEQLSFIGFQPYYLPTPQLKRLATQTAASDAPAVGVALWRRQTAWFLPSVFALLAVVLARVSYQGRLLSTARLLAMGATGYIAVVLIKVFWTLGELAVLTPIVATIIPVLGAPLLALLFSLRRP